MWKRTEDGSVIDSDNKVIFFSAKRFEKDVCLDKCCFLCGAQPSTKKFNNEHVIPRWVLQETKIFNNEVTLPNGKRIIYGNYKVPCCAECNSLLGKIIETPVSNAFKKGVTSVNDLILSDGGKLLFVWLCLLFLKTHIKDTYLNMHLDQRKGSDTIADAVGYDWLDLHHMHCIVRSTINGAEIESDAIGSIVCLPIRCEISRDEFDFADLSFARSMMIRVKEVGLVVAFDDSGASRSIMEKSIIKIKPPISGLQLRELLASVAQINIQLINRPKFRTLMDVEQKRSIIIAERPEDICLPEIDYEIRGKILDHLLNHAYGAMRIEGHSQSEMIEKVRSGVFSLLFDEAGEFAGNIFQHEGE